MNELRSILVALTLLVLFAACGPTRSGPLEPMALRAPSPPAAASAAIAADFAPDPTGSAIPWSPLPIADDPRTFRFAVVTDRTGGHRDGVFEQGVAKTVMVKPDFVMSVGDLIEGYTEDAAAIEKQWNEFGSMVSAFGTRFFYVPGNHDLSNPTMAKAWSRRFGPAYYYFVYRNVLFLAVNTEDGEPQNISDAQIDYFARALADHGHVCWTLLFMHRPLWTGPEGERGRVAFERLEHLLGDRPYTVFAGHFHRYTEQVRSDRRYIVLATTGGASRLRGPLFGEFDHVAWVTMTDQGPRIANLLLSGIQDEDVRTVASAERVQRYERDFHLTLQNTYQAGARFDGGTTTLAIRNDTPSAVTVEASFGPSGPVHPLPHAVKLDIAAGQRQDVPIAVRVDKKLAIADVPAVPFHWTASFRTEAAEQPIILSDDFAFVVAPIYEIATRKRPVIIDGRLDEWSKLRYPVVHAGEVFGAESWTGPDDSHYEFELASDDENLYVAVNVTDDQVAAVKKRPPWEQDGIEITIDPRDDPARAGNRRDYGETWETYAYLAFGPAASPDQMSVWEPQKIPKGVLYACAPTKGGYAAEIAIPHRVLDALRPGGHFGDLRFNIAIHDSEESGGPHTVLWWQPDWHQPHNVVGSGTFRRKK